jgi:hypothetical protein
METAQFSQSAVNVAVGGLVLALTQATKRWTPEGWGPVIAAVWTTIAIAVYFLSQPDWPPPRGIYFDIMAVWVSVYTAALGLYSAATVTSSGRRAIGTGRGQEEVPTRKRRQRRRRKQATETTEVTP